MSDEAGAPAARYLPARDYAAIRERTGALVEAAGGCVAAAHDTRVGAPWLSRYGNPHESAFAPVDVIADLEARSGEPVVTRKLAELAGYVLVPVATAGGARDLMRHLSVISKEGGDAVSGLAAALADGKVDDAEAERVGRELGEAIAALAHCRSALQALAGRATR